MYIGDIALGDTIDFKFTTVNSSGVPTTLAGSPAVAAYPSNNITEITAGLTLTVDHDGRTGMHNVRIVATSGNGYLTATNYAIVITAGTVGGNSVVGYVLAHFSIEARSALRPATAGRTLQVESDGMAHADVKEWLGTAPATPSVAGVPEVDLTHWQGAAPLALTGQLVQAYTGLLGANTINAGVLTADAVAEIQAGLATTAGLIALNDLSLADFFLANSGQVYTAAVPGSVIYEIVQLMLKLAAAVDGKTVQETLRGMAAVLMGEGSGLETTTAVYRDIADTKARVTATVDEFGNRSAVTLDLT